MSASYGSLHIWPMICVISRADENHSFIIPFGAGRFKVWQINKNEVGT